MRLPDPYARPIASSGRTEAPVPQLLLGPGPLSARKVERCLWNLSRWTTSPASTMTCEVWRNEDGVVILSALAPIADAKAVRCRAAATDVKGQVRTCRADRDG